MSREDLRVSSSEGGQARFSLADLLRIAIEGWWLLVTIPLAVAVATFVFSSGGETPYRATATVPINAALTRLAVADLADDLVGESPGRSIDLTNKTLTIVNTSVSRAEATEDVAKVLAALAEHPAKTPEEIVQLEELVAQNLRRFKTFNDLFWSMADDIQNTAAREMTSTQGAEISVVSQFIALDTRIAELYGSRMRLEKDLALKVIPSADYDITVSGGRAPASTAVTSTILAGLATLVAVFLLLVGRAVLAAVVRPPARPS